jgi:hypothetical protein
VIDTLSKTFGAGKENSDDMAIYVANCERIASEFGCCVMPVHHRPKDTASGEPRGHGSLKGGVDTVLLVETGKPNRVSVTKQKDADPGEDMAFNLVQVQLGQDQDGEDVTSCVVELADAPTMKVKGRKLTETQTATLNALKQALVDYGELPPPDIPTELAPPGTVFKVISISAWRDAAVALMASPDKKPDSLRRAFERNVKQLQDANFVHVWKDYAWLQS